MSTQEVAVKTKLMDTLLNRISISPQICNGQPIIKEMRIRVTTILDYLAAGETFDNILAAYPQLSKEDIQACLYFAARALDRKMHAFDLPS